MVIMFLMALIFSIFALKTDNKYFKVTIFNAINTEYKQCELTAFDHDDGATEYYNISTIKVLPFLVLTQNIMLFFLLIICIIKLIQMKKYINNGHIYNQYNSPYLTSNEYVIKTVLCLTILFIISYWASFIILNYYNWSFFPLAISVKITTVIFSVFIYFKQNKQENELKIALIDEMDRDFYALHIDDVYAETASIIYNILIEIEIYPICITALIAEYASTKYVQCIECDKKFGFIECYNDYDIINGATAVIDENDKIRYYLNCDPYSWSQCRLNDNFTELEIFCIECGLKWKCNTCSFQALQETHTTLLVPDGCDICKSNICEDCAIVIFGRNLTLCDLCYNELSISSLSKSSSKSSLKSSSKSPNQLWTNWNFDQSGFD